MEFIFLTRDGWKRLHGEGGKIGDGILHKTWSGMPDEKRSELLSRLLARAKRLHPDLEIEKILAMDNGIW